MTIVIQGRQELGCVSLDRCLELVDTSPRPTSLSYGSYGEIVLLGLFGNVLREDFTKKRLGEGMYVDLEDLAQHRKML